MVYAPFHYSPVAVAHTVALLLEGLRKIQQRCLTLDEQSIHLKSRYDINNKNPLESHI